MENFIRLVQDLDQTTSTIKKVEHLVSFFKNASKRDSAWALHLLSGQKAPVKVSRTFIQECFCEYKDIPFWLFKESSYHVGDSSETISLLRGPLESTVTPSGLGTFIEEELLVLNELTPEGIKNRFSYWWSSFHEDVLFVIHKCFSGSFRLGVSKNLLIEALAQVAEVDKETMHLRLSGGFSPSIETFENLLTLESEQERGSRPYPFFLASPVEDPEKEFLDWSSWCAEWKWDGIRVQLIKRDGCVYLWSRGEELINESFPEIIDRAMGLPDGTVIDGELLAYRDGEVLSFSILQKRLNRNRVSKKIMEEVPVSIMAYDLLEWERRDIRSLPLRERKELLKGLSPFPQSEVLPLQSLSEAKEIRQKSRTLGVEGLMMKGWESSYLVGRRRGQWWKWKVDPMTIDCVLLYAQAGSGKRSNLYTDYTLAVWRGEELLPLAKAYSGLSDEELRAMDSWIKKNTLEKFGPVRSVRTEQVFEIAFEGIQRSGRHKAGVALRFPRILRWRKDKKAEEADTIESVMRFLHD